MRYSVSSTTSTSYKGTLMKLDASNVQLQIPCPNCEQKIPETIGRLKDDPNVTCSSCGTSFTVNSTELDKGIEAAEKMLADFGRSLKNGFK